MKKHIPIHPDINQIKRFFETIDLVKSAGKQFDPGVKDLLDFCLIPGEVGQNVMSLIVEDSMTGLIENILNPPIYVPEIPKGRAYGVCIHPQTKGPILMPLDNLCLPTICNGPPGSGKTTIEGLVALQALKHGCFVTIHDHKQEARKFLNRYPEALVLKADQQYINWISEPVPSRNYRPTLGQEFGKSYSLMPQAVQRFLVLLDQMLASKKPGQPDPSWSDVLRKSKELGFEATARAIESLLVVIGDSGRIRKGPDIQEFMARYRLVIREWLGVTPRTYAFFVAMFLLQLQLFESAYPHGKGLCGLCCVDEGILAFGKQLMSGAGAGYIDPIMRFLTQSRYTGYGLWLNTQSLAALDSTVFATIGNFITAQCGSLAEARIAASLLRLPPEAAEELMSLAPRVIYAWTVGWPKGVKGIVPEYDFAAAPSDDDIARLMQPNIDWLENHTVYAPVREEQIDPIFYMEEDEFVDAGASETKHNEEPTIARQTPAGPRRVFLLPAPVELTLKHPEMRGDYVVLLKDVQAFPGSIIDNRCERLCWTRYQFDKLKRLAVEDGLLAIQKLHNKKGGRPPEVLAITRMGQALLES